jgi:hypothetical protein
MGTMKSKRNLCVLVKQNAKIQYEKHGPNLNKVSK